MKLAIEKKRPYALQMHTLIKCLFSGRINRQKHRHEYTDNTLKLPVHDCLGRVKSTHCEQTSPKGMICYPITN